MGDNPMVPPFSTLCELACYNRFPLGVLASFAPLDCRGERSGSVIPCWLTRTYARRAQRGCSAAWPEARAERARRPSRLQHRVGRQFVQTLGVLSNHETSLLPSSINTIVSSVAAAKANAGVARIITSFALPLERPVMVGSYL